jgi:hypothetical protein
MHRHRRPSARSGVAKRQGRGAGSGITRLVQAQRGKAGKPGPAAQLHPCAARGAEPLRNSRERRRARCTCCHGARQVALAGGRCGTRSARWGARAMEITCPSCSGQARGGDVQTLALVEKGVDSFLACDATFTSGKPFPRSTSGSSPANKSGIGSPTCTARGFDTLCLIARRRFARARGPMGNPNSKANLQKKGKTRPVSPVRHQRSSGAAGPAGRQPPHRRSLDPDGCLTRFVAATI